MMWTEAHSFRPNVYVEIVGDEFRFARRRLCSGKADDALTVVDALFARTPAGARVRGLLVRAEPHNETWRYVREGRGWRAASKLELQELREAAYRQHYEASLGLQALRAVEAAARSLVEDAFADIWGPRPDNGVGC